MSTGSLPTDMAVQEWDEKLMVEFVNEDFFTKFTSTEENAVIMVKEDLTQKRGETIHITLQNQLRGVPKKSNELLEGKEEGVVYRDFKVTIEEYSHAIEWRDYDEQRTAIELRNANKSALKTWNKQHHRDKVITALGSIDGIPYATASAAQKNTWTANNVDRVLFGVTKANYSATHATGLANVDNTNDKMSSNTIKLMKRMAKLGSPKVSPLMPRKTVDASDSFVLFCNPLHVRDLELDTVFMAANRDARTRGLDNPIFSGANYIFGNVAIYEIEEMPIYTGVGAAGIDVAPAYLCGQQALLKVWAKRPWTVVRDKSYGQLQGLALRQWYELAKVQFGTGANDKDVLRDYGVATGFFAAVAD